MYARYLLLSLAQDGQSADVLDLKTGDVNTVTEVALREFFDSNDKRGENVYGMYTSWASDGESTITQWKGRCTHNGKIYYPATIIGGRYKVYNGDDVIAVVGTYYGRLTRRKRLETTFLRLAVFSKITYREIIVEYIANKFDFSKDFRILGVETSKDKTELNVGVQTHETIIIHAKDENGIHTHRGGANGTDIIPSKFVDVQPTNKF